MRRARILLLLPLALAVALLYAGPRLWRNAVPLPTALAAQGGVWRTVALGEHDSLPVVVHQIDGYSFRPGIGVAFRAPPQDPGTLAALAERIARAFFDDVARHEGQFITVIVDVGEGLRAPWSTPVLYRWIWRLSPRTGAWELQAVSHPVPRIA